MNSIKTRAQAFCDRFKISVPILLAPMAGACPPSLSIAVMQAGGMGACGALLMQPAEVSAWTAQVRSQSPGPFQINLWIPDPTPLRDIKHESRVREFLAKWGPRVPEDAGDAVPPDFASQCQGLLKIKPAIVSSVMGLYPPHFVAELERAGIPWCATITTVAEARAAESAGADLIVAQGMEAGGHRGSFIAADAEKKQVGLFALLPAVVDAVKVPVIAAGGIADARGVAAALTLGAHAVAIGTAFLRCPEARIHHAWADALAKVAPEDTLLTRAFSGRAGRSIATDYVLATMAPDAPAPAPYPVQRGLSAAMRSSAQKLGDHHRMQAWAGQSAALGKSQPAADLVRDLWEGSKVLMK
jgi:nitronate monooxygenase